MSLLGILKDKLYFPVAYYFRVFALVRLWRWKPRVIIITGSSGKTTLLKLVEAQLKDRVRYAHKANSSYGIAFNLLDLERKTFLLYEWLMLFLLAPLKAFKSPPNEKIYVVEVDCDRPGEGKFLATLLKPEVVLWLTSTKTHSMNFDASVRAGQFPSIERAVAHEFGYLLQYAARLAIVNGDSGLIDGELYRARAGVKKIHKVGRLTNYRVTEEGKTIFGIGDKEYAFDYLLPEDTFYSIQMALELAHYLGVEPDQSFKKFTLPPGRSSVFKGFKNITIVDSSYNANLDSMRVVLDMFSKMPAAPKWVVLGDMIEQGESEKEEHEKLAELLVNYKFNRVIFMGPRMTQYAYPKLETLAAHFSPLGIEAIEKFIDPTEVLNYLKNNIEGGETILFKGARFLEGVIEHLLLDKKDVKKLCRQEKVWKIRRKAWGL